MTAVSLGAAATAISAGTHGEPAIRTARLSPTQALRSI
jgi:hypothetical protein